jgi:hypothetical protein
MNTNTPAAALLLRSDLSDLSALSASLRAAELSDAQALRAADALASLAARERLLPLLVFACSLSAALAESDGAALSYARSRAADALADFSEYLSRVPA